MQLDRSDFEKLVAAAIDNIPEKYGKRINNVAFVVEDEPNEDQRSKLHLVDGMTLYGLYEGIPLTKRPAGYNLVLPDKITVFRLPLLHASRTPRELRDNVNKTVWHEVAHYFGLDHSQIHKLGG